MKNGYFHRVRSQTATKFWINNVTLEEAQLAIDHGALGCTQNPSYVYKMLTDVNQSTYTNAILDKILSQNKDDNEVELKLQKELVKKVAEVFLPVYEESGAKHGYVSVQGDPFKEDVDTIVKSARFNCEAGPNIMAKIPVTKDGLEAIEILAREGMPINATEVMSVKQALDVCEAYKKATKGMKNSAPIYYSHITGIYDEYLAGVAKNQNIDIPADYLWQAGISVAKKIYSIVKERDYAVGFIGGGARGLHHFTEMVGADACITINWKGSADKLLELNPPVVQRFLQPTPYSVIDELSEKFEDYRKAYDINAITVDEYEEFGPVVLFRTSFEKSWKSALEIIKNRRTEIKA